MKNGKRILSVLLGVLMQGSLFTFIPINGAMASEINNTKEIVTDIQYDNANKDITKDDLKSMQLIEETEIISTGARKNAKVIAKTYKKDELVSRSSNYEERIATFCQIVEEIPFKTDIIPEDNIDKGIEQIQSRASGSKTENDSTHSWQFTITVTYNAKTVSGERYVQITKVSGSNKQLDKSVKLASQAVYIAQQGYKDNDKWYSNGIDRFPSGGSFSFSNLGMPYTRSLGHISHYANARYGYNLRRGTKSNWSGSVKISIT